MGAVKAVFNTFELLEHILIQLPAKKIFEVTHVTRLWHDTIKTSPSIQDAQVLRQRPDDQYSARTDILRPPKYSHDGSINFSLPLLSLPKRLRMGYPSFLGTRTSLLWEDCDSELSLRAYLHALTRQKVTPQCVVRGCTLRKGSILRMDNQTINLWKENLEEYATLPPCEALSISVFTSKGPRSTLLNSRHFNVIVYVKTGIKIGDLLDISWSMENAIQEAHDFTFFSSDIFFVTREDTSENEAWGSGALEKYLGFVE